MNDSDESQLILIISLTHFFFKKMTSFVLRSFVLPPFEHEKKKSECSNNSTHLPKSNNIMFDSRVCRGSTLKPEAVLRHQRCLEMQMIERESDKKEKRGKVGL